METETTISTLTPLETQALESLRANIEETQAIGWASVYLDNAKPVSWDGKLWSAILASLAKKGLYRVDDGYAFGLVLLPERL